MEGYFAEYPTLGSGPDARGPAFYRVTVQGRTWHVRQVLDDPEGDHDWAITAEVDLDASDELGAAAVHVTAVGPMDGCQRAHQGDRAGLAGPATPATAGARGRVGHRSSARRT